MYITANISIAQYLGSARGVGIGALTSLTNDLNSIDWNPAGLCDIKDWEVGLTNYVAQKQSGVALHSLSVGKNFLGRHTVAIRYSPGKILEFIVPTTLSVYDSIGNEITTKFDKKITYHQNYSLGYSYRLTDNISLGLGAKFFETNISDTKYFFDTSYVIQSRINSFKANLWTIDMGALYKMSTAWTIGIALKNLFELNEEKLIDDVREYNLNLEKRADFGAAYEGFDNLKIGIDGDTKKNIRIGAELIPSDWIELRGGIYSKVFENIEAIGIGVGINFAPARLDLSYLKYSKQSNRTGSSNIDIFSSSSLVDIDYTPFTADRILLSVNVNLGRTRETLARIEYAEMLSEVFTAAHQVYAFRPIGKARVKNISSKLISAKVSFYISDIMNAPTETKLYAIAPNEVVEVPFFAVFSDLVNNVKKFSIYDGTVYVHAEVSSDYDDSYQTRVLVRGRNDWDGDVISLKYFVTPDDPDVLKFTRSVLSQSKSLLDTVPNVTQNFEKAKTIFNAFSQRLLYVHDPQKSKDFVQYPSETLSLHGGDCDDMTVGYTSLLMSVGISTAFIDVIPPDHPEDSHIYMMFDTGIDPKEAFRISDNPKRYIIRRNDKGKESVWVPVETTIITKGFDEAWNVGAYQYLQDAEVKMGILKGWMRIVDMQPSF